MLLISGYNCGDMADGLAIELPDGTLYILDALEIVHGVNPQSSPDRFQPKRISEVFFTPNIGMHASHGIEVRKKYWPEGTKRKRASQMKFMHFCSSLFFHVTKLVTSNILHKPAFSQQTVSS